MKKGTLGMYIIHESANSSLPNTLKKNDDYIEFIAILQSANKKNRNGRYYPKKVLEDAIKTDYIRERLSSKSLFAEINHPMQTDIHRQTTIDMNNIGAVITDLFWEGDNLMGRVETLPNQKGRDIMALIKSGVRIAFSMRGQGQVHRDSQLDATVVEPGLCIITFDIVVSPSHADAYLQSICEETFAAFTNLKNYKGNRQMALMESINLAECGQLIDMNGLQESGPVDYARYYNLKHKAVSQYYNFSESDRIESVSEDGRFMFINSVDGSQKKVMAEDFIKKDIRNRICNI